MNGLNQKYRFNLLDNTGRCNHVEVQQALNEYKEYFGVNYFFYIGHEKTDQEIIEEIENCIKTGKKQKEPQYDEDKLY